jgi:hypothetical protein
MGRCSLLLLVTLTWLFFASTASAQWLAVSSSAGSRGDSVAVEISVDTSTGTAPVALTWETVFPDDLLQVEGNGPVAGSAARESGKVLTCSSPKPYSYVCILVGGQKPIGSGLLATFHFKIRRNAHRGPATVRAQRGEAAAVDALTKLSLADAEGTITIR